MLPPSASLLRPLAATAPRTALARTSACAALARPSPRPVTSHIAPRSLSSSSAVPDIEEDQAHRRQGLLSKLLNGNLQSQKEGDLAHSLAVGRGKHIHEIVRHTVAPAAVEAYKEAVGDVYPQFENISGGDVPALLGSWHVHIGEQDTFFHIWRHESYAAYDAAHALGSPASLIYAELEPRLAPTLRQRSNWLAQEFAFWPTVTQVPKAQHFEKMHGIVPAPHLIHQDWIFELRTYHLKPGSLLEWSSYWRRGLEARTKYVEPIGAWFTQIGGLHTVFHIWAYPSLEERKVTRDAAWQEDTWNSTVKSVREPLLATVSDACRAY